MKYLVLLSLLLSASISQAQFKNIKITEQKAGVYPPSEPTIVINKKNPKNIVAGVILDRALYTLDGGETWNESILKSPYGVNGDPALVSDSKGHLYFFHLSNPDRNSPDWLDRIVCQKSTDGGKTWSEGESIGYNPPKDQDKEWAAVHPRKQIICTTWTQFDKYGDTDPNCHSNIMFSMSDNGGKKWSKAIQINQNPGDCIDDDNTTEGAVPAIDNDGRIYVAWSNGGHIYFDRSFDGGNIWLTNDLVVAQQYGGWDIKIPGVNRSNGMPVLMVDTSPSRFSGSLYLVWADQKNGENDTDIWFSRSTSRGDIWTSPIKINKDGPGKHQFLPWMSVDQTTGNIYIVYYDRRDHDDWKTDVYLAYSVDGGNSFTETKISETSFAPSGEIFFGDYTNISAHKGVIAPVWTRMDDGKTSVWTSIIKESDLIKK